MFLILSSIMVTTTKQTKHDCSHKESRCKAPCTEQNTEKLKFEGARVFSELACLCQFQRLNLKCSKTGTMRGRRDSGCEFVLENERMKHEAGFWDKQEYIFVSHANEQFHVATKLLATDCCLLPARCSRCMTRPQSSVNPLPRV